MDLSPNIQVHGGVKKLPTGNNLGGGPQETSIGYPLCTVGVKKLTYRGVWVALEIHIKAPNFSNDHTRIHLYYHLIKDVLDLAYSHYVDISVRNCQWQVIPFYFLYKTHAEMKEADAEYEAPRQFNTPGTILKVVG